MTTKLTDDIYVFLYVQDDNLSMGVAESLEDFQEATETLTILSWANIIGRDMEITEFHDTEELSDIILPEEEGENAQDPD